MKGLTLLVLLTLWTGSAAASETADTYTWPRFVEVEIDGEPHRCVDLEGYKTLAHIDTQNASRGRLVPLLELKILHRDSTIQLLTDQVRQRQKAQEAMLLELHILRQRADQDRDDQLRAKIREIGLWAVAVLEAGALVVWGLSTQ